MFAVPKKEFVFLALLLLSLAACDNPEQKLAYHKERGEALFQQGLWDKARVEYKNAARLAPMDAETTYRLGLIEEISGNIRKALDLFTHAERQNPHFHPAILKRAQYDLASENYEEAQRRISSVLGEDTGNAQAHALLGSLLLRQKKIEGAEKEARLSLEYDPANISAFATLAGVYAYGKESEKAFDVLKNGIEKNPQDTSLHLLKIMIGERFADIQKMEEGYHALIILKPTEASYRFALADLYEKSGMIEKARQNLLQATHDLPQNWNIKKQYVAFVGKTKGTEEAETIIASYQKDYPDQTGLVFWLADLYIANKETDRAILLMEKIVRQSSWDETSLKAHTLLARLNFTKGNWETSEKLARSVLEKDPENPDALFILANKNVINGNYPQAVSELRTILRSTPKHRETLSLLAEVLALQGRTDLAIDILQQRKEIDPSKASVQIRLAQMYHMNGSSDYALQLLMELSRIYTDDPVLWETVARIAIDKKMWPKAEEALHHLSNIPEQEQMVAFLKGQIATEQGAPETAIEDYHNTVRTSPSSALSEKALMALYENALKTKTLGDLEIFIRGLPSQTSFTSSLLGEIYRNLGKNAEAATAYDQAIAADYPNALPFLGRARLYLQEKKSDESIRILEQAERIIPSDNKAPLMRANILEEKGNNEEAMHIYETLLARKPDLHLAANNLAYLLVRHYHDNPKAMERAKTIVESLRQTQDPRFQDTLAWTLYKTGSHEQALAIFDTLASQYPDLPPEIRFHYGATLLKIGKKEDAKKELEKATTGPLSYPDIEEAKKLRDSIR